MTTDEPKVSQISLFSSATNSFSTPKYCINRRERARKRPKTSLKLTSWIKNKIWMWFSQNNKSAKDLRPQKQNTQLKNPLNYEKRVDQTVEVRMDEPRECLSKMNRFWGAFRSIMRGSFGQGCSLLFFRATFGQLTALLKTKWFKLKINFHSKNKNSQSSRFFWKERNCIQVNRGTSSNSNTFDSILVFDEKRKENRKRRRRRRRETHKDKFQYEVNSTELVVFVSKTY